MIGRTISHHKIAGKLGEGGMGVVYKTIDVSLDRTVALKFLAPHLVEDQEGRERFIREAKAAAALDHPNICTVYEINQEQAQRLPTDRRTDIWSLGVVIYEMVTGRLPFEGEREAAVAYSIVHEEPEPMTAQRVDVPVELDRIVGKAMAKSPDERYQHVDELLVDVKALKRGFAPSHPADSKEDSRTKAPIAWIAVAAALTVLAAAVWRLGDSGGSEIPAARRQAPTSFNSNRSRGTRVSRTSPRFLPTAASSSTHPTGPEATLTFGCSRFPAASPGG